MEGLSLDLKRVALERRRTKIIATVGPATSSKEVLRSLISAGVDVFRMNFSHGTQEEHARTYAAARQASAEAKRTVALLADLCGPKIRAGKFQGGKIQVVQGAQVVVTVREVLGVPGLIPCEYRELAQDVQPKDRILIDDGRVELVVDKVQGTEIHCDVVSGGEVKDRKGINLPGVKVSSPSLTEKDKSDAAFAGKLGVDFLALSFVRSGNDVLELKRLMRNLGLQTPVVAKIEKPEALADIGAILAASDGIMVARGDLGVEMQAEEVPIIQQDLIRLSISANRPVIVATQMLESMIENARPTRAEVSDVASAAICQADAVMLSAETAVGKHPKQAVATMDRILRLVEGYQWKSGLFGRPAEAAATHNVELKLSDALSRATSVLSREVDVQAVAVPTRTGRTVLIVSAARPAAPIVAMSSSEAICRQLTLCWGVEAVHVSEAELKGEPAELARTSTRRLGLAKEGEHVLLVWDSNPLHAGIAPSVSILTV
jgi:pyruvate kinase